MRILIAPAPYKECLDAKSVADSIEVGVMQVYPDADILKLPICDGGTGLVDRLIEAKGGNKISCKSHDPLMKEIISHYGVLKDGSAVIESASAAGIALVPHFERNPLITTTYGVGELIVHAVSSGVRRIIIGCGDSATNDGGIGMAQAIGVKFYDKFGELVGKGGGELIKISSIDTSMLNKNLVDTEITVACNLSSILCGPTGTSNVYAKQKGATKETINLLEQGMNSYADRVNKIIGWDLRFMPGTGAAGGLGAGLLVFANACLEYSMTIVGNALNLEDRIKEADIVITGEGMVDGNSASGKAISAVGLLSKKYHVLSIAIVGSIGRDADIICYHGIDIIESITTLPISLQEALEPETAKERVTQATIRIMRALSRFDTGGKLA